MLTGRRVFDAPEVTDVLARVIEREPDWGALPGDVPPAIRRVLRRGLQKDRSRRLQSASDLRIEIDEARTEPEAATPTAPLPLTSRTREWVMWLRRLDAVGAQPLVGTEGARFPFWSPDSRSVAFFAVGRLMRIDLDGGRPPTIAVALSGRSGTWGRDGVILVPLTVRT
jgi:hypothetical protein